MIYKIYAVSGDTMNLVYAFTNYLPIGMDLLLRQMAFLMNCRRINNYVVKSVFEYFGHGDVCDCVDGLGISDLDVFRLLSESVRGVVLRCFVCAVIVNSG